ncbi:acyl-CoA reductase [Robiginitalea sp. SC105]|uniref:acyl-CoA reductase n=1 Tax=Robiginitalea sp. SC105 TaxID=2762332 RepID=UPI001639F4C6|nr:acyl-CoA reductase [Robiginitalea sp. SC105]MBC2840639.1 acyl-CoA reductase [Robiginitalea sp. SC105]
MGQPDTSYRALAKLGGILRDFTADEGPAPTPGKVFVDLGVAVERARVQNPWFTREEVLHALRHWGKVLQEESLLQWFSAYPGNPGKSATVALIMAGNVPLVGFHDLVSVLMTGHRALVKTASSDSVLLPAMRDVLVSFDPGLSGRIAFETGTLSGFDAVIATGSNNTSRYFDYYFGGHPHIIRKNRNSVGILTGNEGVAELEGLADDIFRYFGMGCRSVSKIYVPEGYDFDGLFNAFFRHKHRIDHHKYANNYDYNKAVYLMSGAPMLDNGFLLVKEDGGLGSPIGTLFYETYSSPEALREHLAGLSEDLQCIVGPKDIPGAIPFGASQQPALDAYADNVDTVAFLQSVTADQSVP